MICYSIPYTDLLISNLKIWQITQISPNWTTSSRTLAIYYGSSIERLCVMSFALKKWYSLVTKLWTICMAMGGNLPHFANWSHIGYWTFTILSVTSNYGSALWLLLRYYCIFIECAIISITQSSLILKVYRQYIPHTGKDLLS